MKTAICRVGTVMLWTAMSSMVTTSVLALGFRNPDQNSRATGQGEAFVAQADDASAVWYNPSGLTQLHGTLDTSGAYFSFGRVTFKGAGFSAKNNSFALIPNFYAVTDFGRSDSPWRLGFGFNIPYGDSSDWGRKGPFRYLTTRSSLTVFNMAPSVAYKVNEKFSLGASLNIYHGETTLERNIDLSGMSLPDGHFRFRGDGDAVGGTAGLMYKFNEQNTVGIVYRTPFTIEFNGSASLRDAVALANSGPSAAKASTQFPQSAAIGYAFRPVPKLKLELDLEWTDWETLNTAKLHSPNPLFDANSNPTQASVPFKFKDSFYYEAGAQYTIDEHWTVRSGYIYSENSAPDSTYSPTLPDSNRHIFSVGVGYSTARLIVDLTYQFSYAPTRTVTGSPFGVADGKWTAEGHAFMMGSTFKF